ncbi:carbohydrate-binding protein [Chitinibacter sp. GC72]|uniref:carbohydrate-binding protein n=1 Tax=Chitinibacter sp. GC72 TaxID=1526917 RepID=UPI001E30DFB8|nr:carbohydrate-binding protein [Chitinibacter sp. GC72]
MQSKQFGRALVFALLTSSGLLVSNAQALSTTPKPTAVPGYPNWVNSSVYTGGQRVSYNGAAYEAKWWTQGDNPAQSGEWGAWKLISAATPTPAPTSTPLVCPSMTPPPTATGMTAKPIYDTYGCITGWEITAWITPPPTPTATATATPVVNTGTWNAATAYTAGIEIIYNGRRYRARWWVQGQVPNPADPWGPWEDLGPVGLPTPTPSPTSTATASPSPTPAARGIVNELQVSTWKNGAKGAYSLVHDDYCSMYYGTDPYIQIMNPELKKRGLVAGFGMITGSCSPQHWAAAKEMIANGHEIISHSRSHPNPYIADAELDVQLNGAAADIAANLDGYQASYFVWPGDAASTAATDFLKTIPQYIGGRASHLVANGNVDYTTMPAGVNAANFDNPYRIKWDLFTVDGKWSLYPMGSEILNLHIDAAISQGAWTTRTAHGVDTGYWETIPLDRYLAHLDYAKAKVDSGELWMDTPSNVIKYRYAREFCKPVLTPNGNWSSLLTFDTSAPQCQKYATPITLQMKVLQQGGMLGAIQNGKAVKVTNGPNNTAMITVDPSAGDVTFAYALP